jgi:uncharacterized protein (TIGR02246 family)
MRTILVLAVLTLSAVHASAQDRQADTAAINVLMPALEKAVNDRDLDRMATMFAPDADVMIVDNPLATGLAEMKAGMATQFRTLPATWRIALEVTSVRFIRPDVAIVNTRARFNEGPVKDDRGTLVLVRQDGRWLITAQRVVLAQRAQ